jgi:hypothetical protein
MTNPKRSWVACLSGPRGTGFDQNSNLERLGTAFLFACEIGAILLISGHALEMTQLFSEYMIAVAGHKATLADLWFNTQATNTVENAVTIFSRVIAFAPVDGHIDLHIVTSEWHMERTQEVFQAVLGALVVLFPEQPWQALRLHFVAAKTKTCKQFAAFHEQHEFKKAQETRDALALWSESGHMPPYFQRSFALVGRF